MKTKHCEQCGEPFEVQPYRAESARFCSIKCSAEYQSVAFIGVGRKRVSVVCDNCGKEFEKLPHKITEHNFCSRECSNDWKKTHFTGTNNPTWKGGHVEYRGKNWKTQSAIARQRDNDTCQKCGYHDGSLPVHHIIPFHLFDDYRDANQLENLITYCPTCHMQEEARFWRDNPHLLDERRIPKYKIRECRHCGNDFIPKASKTVLCDDCMTFTCAYCGKEFVTRRATHRNPKYCSRGCRNNHIKVSPD